MGAESIAAYPLRGGLRSVFNRSPVDVVDHNRIELSFGLLEPQTKLLFERLKEIRSWIGCVVVDCNSFA